MTLTIEKQREAGEAVMAAALAWWETQRPLGWNLRKHLDNPSVNTQSAAEHTLAQAIANAVEVGRI